MKTPTWHKKGKIIAPTTSLKWQATYTGAAYAFQHRDTPLFDIYTTGRDSQNRSQIGRFRINIHQPQTILDITPEPLLSFGELGTFDENGVSYPYIVSHQGKLWMYYVGWMPTVKVPFNLQIGLAIQQADGRFKRYSRAPILPRNHDDPFSTGSCCVIKDEGKWKMYYTSFLKWGALPTEHKHDYVIKYAESTDGIHWQRNNHICIHFKNEREYAICRPTVWKSPTGSYYMWYAYRGEQYRIGFATSTDGMHWQRKDEQAGITVSATGWDSESVCYPHVFEYEGKLYMLYNGNEYGRDGLGLAVLSI